MLNKLNEKCKVIPYLLMNEFDKIQLMAVDYTLQTKIPMKKLIEKHNNTTAIYKYIRKSLNKNIKKIDREVVAKNIVDLIYEIEEEERLLDYLYKGEERPSFVLAYDHLTKQVGDLVSLIFSERFVNVFANLSILKVDYDVLENSIKQYCIKDKNLLNFLGLVILLGKIDRWEKHFSNLTKETTRELYTMVLKTMIYYLNEFKIDEFDTYYKLMQQMKTRLESTFREVERSYVDKDKLKIKVKKLSKDKKELEKALKDYKNKEIDNELLQTMKKTISDKDIEVLEYKKKYLDLEKKYKDLKIKVSSIERLEKTIYNMKSNDVKRKQKIKNLENELQGIKDTTIHEILQDYFSENELDEKLFDIINPKYEKYLQLTNNIEEIAMCQAEEVDNEENEEDIIKIQRIGYCEIIENTHYAVLSTGEKIEIKNIPQNSYLGEGQFVRIDHEGKLVWQYSYEYNPRDYDSRIRDFYGVRYINGVPHIYAYLNDTKIYNIHKKVRLREGQVISVDNDNNFIKYYKKIMFNADTFIKSVKAKGHRMMYVVKIFDKGMYLKDIETDEECFKNLDIKDFDIKENNVISLLDDEIITMFSNSRFYTSSSFYQDIEYATVEKREDKVFANKLTGELVIVQNIPYSLELKDGQVIGLDENNNFTCIKPTTTTTIQKKLDTKSKKISNKNKEIIKPTTIEKKGKVLFVGKNTYKKSYVSSFEENGYEVVVVGGYEPWHKINTHAKAKDIDIIIVATMFVSHDNQSKIKKNYEHKRLIFSQHNGANRCVEEVNSIVE